MLLMVKSLSGEISHAVNLYAYLITNTRKIMIKIKNQSILNIAM